MFKFVDSVVNSIIKKKPSKSSQKVKVLSRKKGGVGKTVAGTKIVSQCEHLITNTQRLGID